MWLTEFGWTTANQAKGYEYGKYVSGNSRRNISRGPSNSASRIRGWA